ncbi:MAG: hypothetical protein QXH32_02145 [Candidatus Caldarchaeum sp.]
MRKETQSILDEDIWKKIDFYYEARCDLYHEQADKTLTDSQIDDFMQLVFSVLDKLFNINSMQLVQDWKDLMPIEFHKRIDINKLKKRKDLVVVAVAISPCKGAKDIVEVLKRLGYRKQFKVKDIYHYVFGKSYKHLYYVNPQTGIIELSERGKMHFEKLSKEITIQ